ncbi:MAG: peptidyl-prolyl cis-trans isomerase [candidate division WOR-3 bacterium]
MRKVLALIFTLLGLTLGSSAINSALDSIYFFYTENRLAEAQQLLQQLSTRPLNREQQLNVMLEMADYYLDKVGDYTRAESIYRQIINDYPRHRLIPGVLYRLALAQELQEKYLDAAKNYEQVATRHIKSPYAQDALDAIERCFRKNYQERVAYVNNYPITRIELDDRISRNPSIYESFDAKRKLLDTMIDNRLLYEAAVRTGLLNDPQVRKTLSDLRNRQMFQVWYDRQVTARAEPGEKELRANYRKNIARYTIPEKVQGYQLAVTSKTLAESLRAVLTADTGKWDTIVKTFSVLPNKDRKGDMGMFARGVQPKPIEDVAFRLKPGEISQPVAIGDTWYIIRVTAREPKKVRPFAEVKNQIAVEIRQDRTNKIYEQEIARLKQAAAVIQDTLALAQNKETLAIVNGVPITRTQLEERLNAIPPFFRGQFETPEGRRRILEQLIIEKLLHRECEREKLWLSNRVIDQLINRRAALLIDAYRRRETSERVKIDSAILYAEYKKTLNDFKEPTRVRCREMVARTQARAEQLRRWALAGRIPALIHGIAFLVTDETKAQELARILKETGSPDSIAAASALAGFNLRLPNTPVLNIGGRDLPDLTQPCPLAGPFISSGQAAFAFTDLSNKDRLYQPELITVQSTGELKQLLTTQSKPAYALELVDSTRLGTYARLTTPLPADFINNLFKLSAGEVTMPYQIPGGYLIVKITRKDTAQQIEFAELIRRFSTSGSKWAGGEISLTRNDQARDPKVVAAAYSLSKGAFSPVIKLNDSTYTFIRMEEKKPAYTRPFSEVKGKIENRMRREMEKQLYEQLVNRLRQEAKIEVLMKEEDFQTEPAETEQK